MHGAEQREGEPFLFASFSARPSLTLSAAQTNARSYPVLPPGDADARFGYG
jgi:hypothetical protein